MRALFLTVLWLLPLPSIAAELIQEPHAMLYYRVSFDGGKAQQGHSFGLRMDQAAFHAGEMLEQDSLFQQTALFELSMSARGLEGLYLSGTALLDNSHIHHADEDADTDAETDEGESVLTKVQDVIDNLPFGVFLGTAIGVLILSGLGG